MDNKRQEQLNEMLLHYLKNASKGDREAFTSFAENIAKRVLTIAFRVLKDKMYAEDVLNETLIKIWQNLDKIINLKKPIGYINAIAYNLALDFWRKKTPSPIHDNMPAKTADTDLKLDIDTAFAKLEPLDREIVSLHLEMGYSLKQVAGFCNLTEKATYYKYSTALKKLQNSLKPNDFSELCALKGGC